MVPAELGVVLNHYKSCNYIQCICKANAHLVVIIVVFFLKLYTNYNIIRITHSSCCNKIHRSRDGVWAGKNLNDIC